MYLNSKDMNDEYVKELSFKLDECDRKIWSSKKFDLRTLIVICVLFLFEIFLFITNLLSIEIVLDLLSMTSAIGLSLSFSFNKTIMESRLNYADLARDLRGYDVDAYETYFKRPSLYTGIDRPARKCFCFIYIAIMAMSLTLSIAIELNTDFRMSECPKGNVVLNNEIVITNDSTIVIRKVVD